jgi:acylpyruvate hydrolase
MKLVTFAKNGESRIGVVLGEDSVVDLIAACAWYRRANQGLRFDMPGDMIGFLKTGGEGLEAVGKILASVQASIAAGSKVPAGIVFEPEQVRLKAPVEKPGKIVCLGRNYAEHAKEGGREAPGTPLIFAKAPTSIIGPGEPVIYPKLTKQLDYEVELAVVIGRKGREIQEEKAYDYIAGYTVMNDVTARDIQFGDKLWFRGKSFDTFGPTGPWIVLKDEIPDPHSLRLSMKVNGEIRQDSSTKELIFKIPFLIAFVSAAMTLEPGDILSTGTPSGVGIFMKPEPKLLQVGDVMEAWVEKIGVLKNPVAQT